MTNPGKRDCAFHPSGLFERFSKDRAGNIATYFAVALLPLMVGAGVAVDYSDLARQKSQMQQLLDGAVLAGASADKDHAQAAEDYFQRTLGRDPNRDEEIFATQASFQVDGSRLRGKVDWRQPRLFGLGRDGTRQPMRVLAEVQFRESAKAGPCITVLADQGQALLLNSGARVKAPDCEIHVHSTRDPAFIMNAGVDLDIAKLCVKGNRYIRNGGTLSHLETNCAAAPDAYAGKIPEPTVPSTCQTSGARDGSAHTLNPGAHCWVNFNGSPTITFKPGLHIIRGPMVINSGSTVIAEGVTFYFPDTGSHIQANGNLSMTASAPSSGPHAGVLMFEKTSDPANNSQKRQYVFNGSNGEKLEGLIYLPNRDVTYNSTTNISGQKLSMVINTLIINSANWAFAGYGAGGTTNEGFYLSR